MRPLVLCASGHDPTGGAGIHADIEAIAGNGAHALSLITAHTVQDTQDVVRVSPVAPILLASQIETLLADCSISAFKIGLLGDAQQIPVLVSAIAQAKVPVVLDPILRAGGGASLASAALQAALQELLLPHVTVLTPNAAEARRLTRKDSLDEAAQVLQKAGVRHVLITGGDEPGATVTNRWYHANAAPRVFEWPRLPGGFHGAGCTLAAAIAANLARGLSIEAALEQAQRYTHESLARAFRIGQGRQIPGRVR